MRVEVSNLAAANFNFQSILSSKSLFAENPTECPQESQSRRKREQKFSSSKSRKTSVQWKKRSPLVHSSRKSRKLSAVAVVERREEEKKEERKRWRHHSKHQSYVCEKICKNHLTIL
jgi:hypothetical protein